MAPHVLIVVPSMVAATITVWSLVRLPSPFWLKTILHIPRMPATVSPWGGFGKCWSKRQKQDDKRLGQHPPA